MHVQHAFDLVFDEQAFLDFHGDRFARMLERPDQQASYRAALEEIQTVITPCACWDRFPVEAIDRQTVRLAGGVTLKGSALVRFVEHATELVVLLCTIGPAADEHAAATYSSGQAVKSMMLDELSIWMLGQVRQEALKLITDEARACGLHTGVPISPGQLGWPVTDQRRIFALVDGSQIGMTLNPSCVMLPFKSTSTVMGLGPAPVGPAVAGKVACDFCPMKSYCRYSRAGQGAASAV